MSDKAQTVDLTNCDREPIHLLGNVQGYGCLIGTDFDMKITHISANVETLLGIDPQTTIGLNLRDVLPPDTIHALNGSLQLTTRDATVGRLFGVDVLMNGLHCDVSVHTSGTSHIFEFEPVAAPDARNDLTLVQPLVDRLRRAQTAADAVQDAALAMQILSGFDRVMVYRFAEDGTGEVIAEQRQPGMEPFLGLRYPASDIPQQARALYKRSLLRLIADVNGEVSPILSQTSAGAPQLDLSLSVTRAVSPIHLEYLRNMGVAASMSVSILKDGELWGLFACHNMTPKYINYARRSAIELFAQFFSYELLMKCEQEGRRAERDARQMHDALMVKMSRGSDLIAGFDLIADELSGMIACDGISVFSDGRYAFRGKAPTAAEFQTFRRALTTTPSGTVFSTDKLTEALSEPGAITDRVAGVLAIPISRTPRDFIVFYRQELTRTVKWAGNPEKPVTSDPNGPRLTPRQSFAAWEETVRGTSKPWTETEKRTAEALRQSLIEIVLKLTDEANLVRKKAAETQALLIAELNHRVRNILNLINSLVTQSKDGAETVDAYTAVLGARVQALAIAHDQLTRSEWEPTSLRDLIDVEINAFLSDRRNRFMVTGAAPMITPEAFSTVALMMHEMVTNSVKYGALSGQAGQVAVNLTVGPENSLQISWRESGGPPVVPPTRRGFGSTIIEKSIPFELSGTVDARYAMTGFEADVMIPAEFVTVRTTNGSKPVAIPATGATEPIQLKNVLVVEDNMLIAMDIDSLLRKNGALQTYLANSVDAALAIIADEPLTIAVLDVNLGQETSLPVAQELWRRGLPFVLASGYGDAEAVVLSFPTVPIVSKPLTADTLMAALSRAFRPNPKIR